MQDTLENEGQTLTFDTRELLDFVELEQLSSEEILDIKSKLGIFQAYVQLKKVTYNKETCIVYIYRIIIVSSDSEEIIINRSPDSEKLLNPALMGSFESVKIEGSKQSNPH